MDISRLEDIRCGKKLDGILITDPYNIRYISGYQGEGMLFYTAKEQYILTDSRYVEQAAIESPAFVCVDIGKEGYAKTLHALLPGTSFILGFEDLHISYHTFSGLKQELVHTVWAELSDAVNQLRMIKTEEEIEAILMAEHIGDLAFSHMLHDISPGITEKEIALELEYFMKQHGAESLSFDTIAASGPNSSMPHAIPTDRRIASGDFLTMDFGCRYMGYCSDMTRTVGIGTLSAKQETIYDIVLNAQQAAIAAIRPGMACNEIDGIARSVIRDAGYGNYFGHGLGHSVGLFIHEEPRFSPKCTTILKPGMVLTVEPGIYLPGQFGVRIEDVIVVTEHGCRNLTSSEKKLLLL